MSQQHPPLFKNLEWVTGGKVYRSEGAFKLARKVTPIAGGYNDEYLMRSPKGSYFRQFHQTLKLPSFLGGTTTKDEIHPLTQEEAYRTYSTFPEKLIPLDEAFPGLEEA